MPSAVVPLVFQYHREAKRRSLDRAHVEPGIVIVQTRTAFHLPKPGGDRVSAYGTKRTCRRAGYDPKRTLRCRDTNRARPPSPAVINAGNLLSLSDI